MAATEHYLLCISGPDQGKRLVLGSAEAILGRSTESNLLSDDPDVSERAVALSSLGGVVRMRSLSAALPYVNGHPAPEADLLPGHQVRFGRSLWEVRAPGVPTQGVFDFVSRIGDHISGAAGIEKPSDWSPRTMFSEVIARHTDEEVEEYFTVGTPRTTPPLSAIDTGWPKPWVFVRVLAMTLILYAIFVAAWREFGNANLIPGLIMVGSVAIPFALLIFFFEMNAPRNISMYQVIKLLLLGGAVSILISLFGFRWTELSNWMGAASAGIIEEAGKGLALLLVINRPRFRWTLNGLLLGAAVGAGFAAFETAGYALWFGMDYGDTVMFDILRERGFMSVLGGHVLWTALVGAALWRVRGDAPFRLEMLIAPAFLRVFGVCVILHMVWNWSGFSGVPFYGKYLVLGAVAWLLILGMIQSGLREIREAQMAAGTGASPA